MLLEQFEFEQSDSNRSDDRRGRKNITVQVWKIKRKRFRRRCKSVYVPGVFLLLAILQAISSTNLHCSNKTEIEDGCHQEGILVVVHLMRDETKRDEMVYRCWWIP